MINKHDPKNPEESSSKRTSGTKPPTSDVKPKKANKIASVPTEVLVPKGSEPATVMPQIEKEHVHNLYNDISEHWSHTRYKPWPKVVEFLESLPKNGIVFDVGCGNGKYLAPTLEAGAGFVLGTDLSVNLLDLAIKKVERWGGHDRPWDAKQQSQEGGRHAGRKHNREGKLIQHKTQGDQNNEGGKVTTSEQANEEGSSNSKANETVSGRCEVDRQGTPCDATVSDIVQLALRSNIADGAVCIAVLHHLSTRARRLLAIRELQRILAVGGRALMYAWAKEQEANSRREFPTQDCFVPWHFRQQGKSYKDGAAGDFTVQRYCHVFVKGEIEELVEEVDGLEVEQTYFDKGNWCVIVKCTQLS